MTNRRNFLKNAALLTAGTLLAGKSSFANAATAAPSVHNSMAAGKKIGLQIYSLQGELYKDTPARMQELKKMGYTDLELAGYSKDGKIGGVDMMEFKKMAEDAGLKITSSHVNPPTGEFTKESKASILEFWKKAADDHVKLGCELLIQPMMPKCESYDDAAIICEIFNESGKIIKAAGLPFGYHNHNMEFQRVMTEEEKKKTYNFWEHPGTQIYDLFLKETDPSLVFFELDVYWTVMGQNDPVEYMQKHKDRIKALHIKDRSLFGKSGMMNFEAIFNQMYENGIKYYFVELEPMHTGMTQFEGVKQCADYLLSKPFVK